ncbi:MAG: LptF/LptG family permease [Phycisphaerales bacterium]|nr:LptF/LptG family permease [Phycisphaerales bacterium]
MTTVLHGYFLRELLKTFGLTLTLLTLVLTLGGGLFTFVQFEGISAADVAGWAPQMVPLSVTLAMPIAALFAVTMTYGRFAADNELTACSAAGVNVHRLFTPVVVLALFVGAFELLFFNFVIPGLGREYEVMVRRNVGELVRQRLQTRGFVHRGREGEDRVTITAERVQTVTDEALREKGFEVGSGLQYLLITQPTFLHIDRHGSLVQFIVARQVLCLFDSRSAALRCEFHVREGQNFELGKRMVEIREQRFRYEEKLPPLVRLSWTDLPTLLRWRAHPWEEHRFSMEVERFLQRVLVQCFNAYASGEVQAGRDLVLTDNGGWSYTLRATELRWRDTQPVLVNTRVELRDADGRVRETYQAPLVEIRAGAQRGDDGPHLAIALFLMSDARGRVVDQRPERGGTREREDLTFDLVQRPTALAATLAPLTAAEALRPGAGLPVESSGLELEQISLRRSAERMQRRIDATIHLRQSWALSALVMLPMGAALGVIFRGARMLAAIGLTLIPLFAICILLVLGRQLTESGSTHFVGPFITWGGLVLVLCADLLIMRLGVRR